MMAIYEDGLIAAAKVCDGIAMLHKQSGENARTDEAASLHFHIQIGAEKSANAIRALSAQAPSQSEPLAEARERGTLEQAGVTWSFLRSVLAQGIDIHKDYMAGNHKGYEEYSARLDAAAHERLEALASSAAPALQGAQGAGYAVVDGSAVDAVDKALISYADIGADTLQAWEEIKWAIQCLAAPHAAGRRGEDQ